MKIRKPFLIVVIVAIVGMVTACEEPDLPEILSEYTASFEANGGSPAPQNQTISHGGKVIMPSNMTKTGYSYDGWYKEADYINQWNFTTDTVTDNITLYAKWRQNMYTVNFNANDGSPAPAQQIIAYGDKIPQPAYMTKPGYGFGGWYKEADCINQWNFATDIVTGNITLYTKWDSNYYTVSFNTDGGSPVPQQQDIAYNGKASEPPDLSKTGFTFGGWYKEENCINSWDFDTDTVTENITLYAKWTETFTVTFNADGGSPAPTQQSIVHGGKVTEPAAMTKTGYTFGGWYKEAAYTSQWAFNNDTVTVNITLYAKWNPPLVAVPGTTLAIKLQWVASNAASNTSYLLEVNKDEFLNSHTLYFSGKSNITIQLTGIEGVKNIEIYNSGSLFTIENNVTLVLNENIILKGKTNNNAPLVMVNGGNLIMNNGSKITGNSIASSGSGVYVNSGTFTMNGGEISGNSSSPYSSGGGGGVYVGSGTFTMNDGEISGNTSSSGGGVYIGSGIFIMTGGKISGNYAASYGGGVYVGAVSYSNFEKTGGIITGYSSDTVNGNVVKSGNNIRNNCGHAVYAEHNDNRFIKYKEYTVGQQNNLTYIRNEPAPIIISGDWNLPTPDAPGIPTIVTLSSGSLTVQWTAVERALAYEVWMGTTNNATYATKRADVFGVSSTLTGLTNGTTYYVWVKAKNDTGTSGFGPMTSDILLSTPGAPTVTPGLKQLQVTWTLVPGADEYEVYYGTGTPTTLVTTTTGTTATITGLNNGTTYYVRLRGKKTNGISDYGPTANNVPGSPGLYRGNEGVGNQNLSTALSYISSNAVSGDDFYIVLGADESASPATLDYSGKTVGITLRGYGGERTITLTSNGSMFTINNGVTLTLDENITLQGRSNNNSSLVRVNDGTFTMNGGKISGNTASSSGGGVYVGSGTFTMNGGKISGNTSYGGGVYIDSGTFTMNGGEISGNTASSSGGGVYVASGTFTMNGGKISGNTSYYGGGVYNMGGTFIMTGGEISGNSASSYGGGVFMGGTFTMTGGEISGNTASSYGGGVCFKGGFSIEIKKTGGIITGYSSDTVNGNVVKYDGNVQNNRGHAVYTEYFDYNTNSSPIRRKETTSGQGDNLIYIIRNDPEPPTISGAWDE